MAVALGDNKSNHNDHPETAKYTATTTTTTNNNNNMVVRRYHGWKNVGSLVMLLVLLLVLVVLPISCTAQDDETGEQVDIVVVAPPPPPSDYQPPSHQEWGTCTERDASGECVATTTFDATEEEEDDEDDDEKEEEDDDDDEDIKPGAPCVDKDDDCPDFAEQGECDVNPDYMLRFCRLSCQVCTLSSDDSKVNLMLGEDFGVAQSLDPSKKAEILELITSAREYMQTVVHIDPAYARVKDHCRNQEAECTYWAVLGECQANAKYMNTSCAPVCQTCEQLDYNYRCPLDSHAVDIWKPGDLNKMFERLTTDPDLVAKYQPTILSRPDYRPGDSAEHATYQLGPWVITLENVVSAEEAQILIDHGAKSGYQRSSDVGKMKFDGSYDEHVNDGRTSTNAWCSEECYTDPAAQAILQRLEYLTGIPDNYTEYLQLLRYEVGQFYQTHHDYIEFEQDRPDGVRVLTVFLYLNDVEAGGGTNFPNLNNLTVTPRLGRALVWPSVLDEQPHEVDYRTEHQALPVQQGIKYGANAWMHQRDFKSAYAKNCV